MRPKDLPHGVAQPRPSTSSAASKVTGILMEQGGEGGLCHIVPNYEIAIRRAHIPSESRATLSERFIGVGQLAQTAEECRQRDGSTISGIFSSYLELLPCC